jgi:glycine hydroxymethyltransferase
MALDSVCQRGDRIAALSADSGGYRGYTSGYVPEVLGLDVSYLPFDRTTWNVDLGSALRMVREDRPKVVVVGGTIFLFPHPVKEIAEAVHSYGGRVIYDGSHVMGLVAGGSFQDPLKDGADLLLGSTHKTLFGPQGGMVVSNDEELLGRLEARSLYRFFDNFQLNRVAALGIALEEARQHARMYSRRVIDNAKALANELSALGLPVAGKPVGFTESHQVLMPFGNDGGSIRDKLEPSGVIVDSMVRLGTNEVTRRGMGTKEMTTVAGLIRRALSTQTDPKVKKEVAALANRFGKVHYTLKERFSTKKQIH